MILAELIKKGALLKYATATPATSATPTQEKLVTVAKVATVAVADLKLSAPIPATEYRNLPQEWVAAFTKIHSISKPAKISSRRWEYIKCHTERLLTTHIHDIVKHDWPVADIFGCHYVAPEKRYDAMGLLMLMGECKINRIEEQRIVIETPTKAEQSFYRHRLKRTNEQIMIWELK